MSLAVSNKIPRPLQISNSDFYGFTIEARNRSMREMHAMQASIRSKPDWVRKIQDEEIAKRYEDELKAQANVHELTATQAVNGLKLVATVLQQLKNENPKLSDTVSPSHVPGVWFSDGLVPEEVTSVLIRELGRLAAAPDSKKDWHPGSDNQVLDLIHPSLYCYVAGVTSYADGSVEEIEEHPKVPPMCEQRFRCESTDPYHFATHRHYFRNRYEAYYTRQSGRTMFRWNEFPELNREEIEREHYTEIDTSVPRNSRFEWIPTDFKLDDDLTRCRALDYINNLPRRDNQELYEAIERVLALALPMWECVLNRIDEPDFSAGDDDDESQPDFEDRLESRDRELNRLMEGLDSEDDDRWEYEQELESRSNLRQSLWNQIQELKSGKWAESHLSKDGMKNQFKAGSTVQVIVKAANIVLTPEKPHFPGGVWHLEGMPHEKIAATAIYYYDGTNVTESELEFRVAIGDEDIEYEQGDHEGVEVEYGIQDEEELNLHLGAIKTNVGRCIAFPNRMQHRVKPFRLVDESRAGERKILVLFLIDPTENRASTSIIPPQQTWWSDRNEIKDAIASRLNDDLAEHVMALARIGMSLEDAKKYREELMHERKFVVDQITEEAFERPFSLCEH